MLEHFTGGSPVVRKANSVVDALGPLLNIRGDDEYIFAVKSGDGIVFRLAIEQVIRRVPKMVPVAVESGGTVTSGGSLTRTPFDGTVTGTGPFTYGSLSLGPGLWIITSNTYQIVSGGLLNNQAISIQVDGLVVSTSVYTVLNLQSLGTPAVVVDTRTSSSNIPIALVGAATGSVNIHATGNIDSVKLA
jgi:hypothetical protein